MRDLRGLWSLEGRCAVVTGAAQGFGAAIARRLAEAGASVGVADINEAAARDAACRIAEQTGGVCAAFGVDIADEKSVESLFEEVVTSIGEVDVLVNNAGVFSNFLTTEMPSEEFDRIIRVNVTGTFLCSRAVARSMKQRGGGAIVNVASVDSLTPSAEGLLHYTTSKHAVAGLTRSLAMELAPSGIRVNAVAPGATDTPMLRRSLSRQPDPGAAEERSRSRHAMGRFGRPEEIAEAICFLLSDRASFITGVTVPVDGGWLAA